jgi:hypothetical protein
MIGFTQMNRLLSILITPVFVILISSYNRISHGNELVLNGEDEDTIACFDGLSMSKYRERCTNNFPELKDEVESAYQS